MKHVQRYEHLITFTVRQSLMMDLQNHERKGWELCTIFLKEDSVLMVLKRPVTPTGITTIKIDETESAIEETNSLLTLQSVRTRAEKAKARAKVSSADWNLCCYILDDWDDPRKGAQ